MTAAPARSAACVVSPHEDDARLAVGFLRESGIEAFSVESLRELAARLDDGVGCAVLMEESLIALELPALREAIARRPAWADLPLIFVAREVAPLVLLGAQAFPDSGNVTLLDRPLSPHTLVSAVQVALRAAARQREVGELLAERERALRLRDEFLAMLAHELRNPLAPMRNALYLLREPGDDPSVLRRCTAVLERQVDNIVRIVDDLMDVARLERGKVSLRKRRVDLNGVVAAAVEGCRPAARARGHTLVARLHAAGLPLDADAVRVEQMATNLVHNAIKYTRAPGEIVIETAAIDGQAVLSVQDPGVGFEPETGERLFAPFHQVDPGLERTAGGLGIGLTIVRRLVELHGGSVAASSPGPGKGARFIVRLPLATGPAAPEPEALPVRRGPRQRIVVIEDNDDIRDTLTSVLRRWGHDVAAEADGHQGLARVLHMRPDVALVDLGIPGLNGYEVARRIRAGSPDRAVRLIAITGYGQPADRERALEAGFDAHLLKPVAPEVLARELAG